MMRDSVVLYRSFYEAVRALPVKLQRESIMNIMAYAFDGQEPAKPDAVFILMKPQIDANNKKFEDGCKGSEFGKRGGRPKKNPIGVSECDENEVCENPIGVSENAETETPQKPHTAKTETPQKPHNAKMETPQKPLMRNEKCEMRNENEKESRESALPVPEFPHLDDILKGTGFSVKAADTIRKWESYKRSKGQPLPPQTLTALVNRIAQSIVQFGEPKVLWCIDESIVNGWNNIRWEKLEEQKDNGPAKDYNAMVMDELMEDL